MVGPILHQELVLSGRRNRIHWIRWIYCGWLILQVLFLFYVFQNEQAERAQVQNQTAQPGMAFNQTSAPEYIGAQFSELFVWQQMLLLTLVTPVFVAGAITDEKRSGTLQYLLTAGVETRAILLGKLLGRISQVGLVALAGVPLFALLAGFGGVEPICLLFIALVTLIPLFGLASMTVLASVLCRQTRDAVLILYTCFVVGGLLLWATGTWQWVDPLHVLGPVWGPADNHDIVEAGRRLLILTLGWGLLGGVSLAVGVWQLRPAYNRELLGSKPGTRWYSGARPAVHDHPVRWRESNVEGLAPFPTLRNLPRWLCISGIVLATTISSLYILYQAMPNNVSPWDLLNVLLHFRVGKFMSLLPQAGLGFLYQAILVMLLASLVVGIRCSGAVSGERERKTWEALLMTPISAKQLIFGKLWGIIGASYWYLVAYAVPALILSAFGGVLALVYTVLGLAVTVLAMFFIGAAGLWCSTQSKNSWVALLKTIGVGYVGGTLIYLVTSPAIFIVFLILGLLLMVLNWVSGINLAPVAFQKQGFATVFIIASWIGLAIIFYIAAYWFLKRAQRWVADRERTRHWYDEPFYRRPVRAEPREVLPWTPPPIRPPERR